MFMYFSQCSQALRTFDVLLFCLFTVQAEKKLGRPFTVWSKKKLGGIMEQETKTVESVENNAQETGTVEIQTTNENQSEGVADAKAEAQKLADAIVAKKMKGMPTKDELKAFKAWQESQKTEVEKQSEISQKLTKAELELNNTKQLLTILKKGNSSDLQKVISLDDAEFIQFKVSKMEGDFEDNLEKFFEDNPKYLQKKEKVDEQPKTTGVSVNKIATDNTNGVTSILKAKHPELFN